VKQIEPYVLIISGSYFIFIVLEITLFLHFHCFFTFVWLLYNMLYIPQPTNISTHFSSVTLTLKLLLHFYAPFLFVFFSLYSVVLLWLTLCFLFRSPFFRVWLSIKFSVAYSLVWHFSRTWDTYIQLFSALHYKRLSYSMMVLTLNYRLYKQIVTSVFRFLPSLLFLLRLPLAD
jgi:hypothetical protein